MKLLSNLIERKNKLRYHVGKYYYQYGLFCSTRPIVLILFSCCVVILCSLPLTSFPIFEKILAFLFQRIQVKYHTVVSPASTEIKQENVFAYVQQIHINTSITGNTKLSTEDMIENILQLPAIIKLEDSLRQPSGKWNLSCLRLHRDPPSMKALKKRIKYAKGSIHNDLRMRRFYLLDCLFVSPNVLFDHGQSEMLLTDFSLPFQELTMGYPMKQFHSTERFGVSQSNKTKNLSFMFTLFLKKYDKSFQLDLIESLTDKHIKVNPLSNTGHRINYQFSSDTAPAELIPLTIAYVLVFFYLWFSIAKLDLLRTRWGLAFSAVMNFVMSLTMAIGVCATFDALPSTSNVRFGYLPDGFYVGCWIVGECIKSMVLSFSEIFPYIVILIGIENFWIITKAVMTSKKDLQVQERVARGLSTEGWYITKNLVVEILLLGVGYMSGVKVVQEFSVFALACYLSDFFLQMTFFMPILAVDTRRAEIGLPFTNRSAWKYAFYIDLEKPDGTRSKLERPVNRFSAAVKLAFNIAKYRMVQRGVMVVIVIYFAITLAMPIQKMVRTVQNIETNRQIDNHTTKGLSCWKDGSKSRVTSWLFLCGKHWPELMNYYFVHLNEKSLFILPQIDVSINLQANDLHPAVYLLRNKNIFQRMLQFFVETSKPLITIIAIILFTLIYKFYSVIQSVLLRLHETTDIYSFHKTQLLVPTANKKKFMYKLTKMVADDFLVCSYNNGAVYVWDLYDGHCSYYVNRKSETVQNMNISRSLSTYSLPVSEHVNEQTVTSSTSTSTLLPRAVWSLAYKSDVLIIGCAKGSLEIYSLENEALQCFYQSENEAGIIAVQIISCLRFVLAHENGVIEFCHLKSRPIGHKRTSSLPQVSQSLRELEVSRSVAVSYGLVRYMELAIDKIFVASDHGQLKILRGSDDGGILLQSQLPLDQEITCIRAEVSPEMVIVGTKPGNVYILNSVGQTVKQLSCVEDEVVSITSDDDYIAVLSIDCQLYVWLKEGYVKWWQVNLVSYGGAYEIVSLARYSLAAVNKDSVTVMNIVSRTIISSIVYDPTPTPSLILAQPVLCQNKSSIIIPSSSHAVLLKFPMLIDRDR